MRAKYPHLLGRGKWGSRAQPRHQPHLLENTCPCTALTLSNRSLKSLFKEKPPGLTNSTQDKKKIIIIFCIFFVLETRFGCNIKNMVYLMQYLGIFV